MKADDKTGTVPVDGAARRRKRLDELPPAAQRALREAEERRSAETAAEPQKEVGGRGGKDPARYGDWEIKGRAIDF